MASRPWLTGSFWLDTIERTIRTLIAAVLGFLTQGNWPGESDWKVIGTTTLVTFLMCIIASGIGERGTASVMNPAPPDTLKDAGYSAIRLLFIGAALGLTVLAALTGQWWGVGVFLSLALIQIGFEYLDTPAFDRMMDRRDRGAFEGGGWWIVVVVAIVLAVLFILEKV